MPFVIGIAGGTGSGKSTLARALIDAVPEGHVTALEHDHYYRDLARLDPMERDRTNFDHPDALETELLVEHLARLRSGAPVDIPVYDFATHTRLASTRTTEPSPVILVEGILVLADEQLRAELDLKIFVDTDADVRILRRVARDLRERARTFESIESQYYATVRPMHLLFVEPSKRFADIIIPEGGSNVALDLLITKLRSLVPSGGVQSSSSD